MSDQLILLHGALGSADQLRNLSEALQKEGFSVFTMNFSGHGGKPFQSNFGISQFSDELKQFVDANALQRANIFGYSMGGYVALYLASLNPGYFRKIITLGTKFDWTVESSAREVKKLDPSKIAVKVPEFARLLEERHKPNDWKQLVHNTASMMTDLGLHPALSSQQLKQVSNEVLIAVGDGDDMVDRTFSEHVASTLPDGSFSVLENTPHAIERVDELMVAALIKSFLHPSQEA
jgi:pimeloyl-ACP methyl ester carboxylesterase